MVPNRDKDDDRKQKDSGSSRGFASMDEDKQREIASKGGKASHPRTLMKKELRMSSHPKRLVKPAGKAGNPLTGDMGKAVPRE